MSAGRAGPAARAARAILRVLLGSLFRLRLAGTPPARGPYLLIANHQGWADAFVLIALLPAEPRVHFLAERAAVRSHWWKRAIIALLGGLVLVDRAKPSDRAAIRDSLRVLEGGGVLALFPEGRVSRREADLGPFERGTGWLAYRAQAPVVPHGSAAPRSSTSVARSRSRSDRRVSHRQAPPRDPASRRSPVGSRRISPRSPCPGPSPWSHGNAGAG